MGKKKDINGPKSNLECGTPLFIYIYDVLESLRRWHWCLRLGLWIAITTFILQMWKLRLSHKDSMQKLFLLEGPDKVDI